MSFLNKNSNSYKCNLRELCKWCAGLKRYSMKTNQEVIPVKKCFTL